MLYWCVIEVAAGQLVRLCLMQLPGEARSMQADKRHARFVGKVA
jgi:hypothetical protein